jgi:hypothetical protein
MCKEYPASGNIKLTLRNRRVAIRPRRCLITSLIGMLLVIAFPITGQAFSVLAHQAIVDQSWDQTLLPELRRQFPNASEQELREAHSYARGGSHLPDLGYFPLGSHLFSDLLHYVRTGDFITRLLNEASSPDEYAFALGMLAHYEADIIGHAEATNLAVPIIYPKLAEQYGEDVTYADSPSAHLETEFRFDILQAAHRREIPGLLEHSIEFKVPKEFLEKVFRETYGVELRDLFVSYGVAINTYRWGFRTLIDEGTGIAWALYSQDIESLEPGVTSQQFAQVTSRADFVHEFGKAFLEPGYFVQFVGFIGNLVPNIGPLKRLPYKPLPQSVQQLYFRAFHNAYEEYIREVGAIAKNSAVLANLNLDTGRGSQFERYPPADKTYVELLERNARDHFANTPTDLTNDMHAHFSDPDAALAFETSQRDRREAVSALSELDSAVRDGRGRHPRKIGEIASKH